MSANVYFPQTVIGENVKPQVTLPLGDSLVGYRVATVFRSQPATPLLGFGVQLLVAQHQKAPDSPGAIMPTPSGQNPIHVTSLIGREAVITVGAPHRPAYTFKKIKLNSAPQQALAQPEPTGGYRKVHLMALNFSYEQKLLNNTNEHEGLRLIDIKMTGNEKADQPVGTFGFKIEESVLKEASKRYALEIPEEIKSHAGKFSFGKEVESLFFDPHGADGAALSLKTPRDGMNGWLNALVLFNAAQHNDAVPMKMIFHVNGKVWPSADTHLDSTNASAFFVEEVWGWAHAFPALKAAEVRRRTTRNAAREVEKIDVSEYFDRSLNDLRIDKIEITTPAGGRPTERVGILFHGDLSQATLFG